MGILFDFNVFDLQENFNLECMLETGTYRGRAVEYGSIFFNDIYSVDISEEYYKKNLEKFKNNNKVHLYCGTSTSMLLQMLKDLGDRKTLFWLDAHCPTKHLNGKIVDKSLDLPLLDELKIISENKDISGDVFIIDDVTSLYGLVAVDGNMLYFNEQSNFCDLIKSSIDILVKHHNVGIQLKGDGYLFSTPKDVAYKRNTLWTYKI